MNKNAKKQAEKLETKECAYDKCKNTFIVRKTHPKQKYCKENIGDQDCCKRAGLEKYYLEKYGTTEPPPEILEKNKKCENTECTNTFDLKRGQPKQKYCSNECCNTVQSATEGRTGVYVYEKNKKCAYIECENTFDVLSNVVNRKYCSKKCSKLQTKIENKIRIRSNSVSIDLDKKQLENIFLHSDSIVEQLEWQICYICHESFKGKNGEWCCGDECKKNAYRPKLHYDIFNRDGFRCNYCGLSPLTHAGIELTLDHVRPWARARDDRACNIITCCSTCNSEKGTSLVYNEEEVYKEIAERNMKYRIDPNTVVNASTKHRKF